MNGPSQGTDFHGPERAEVQSPGERRPLLNLPCKCAGTPTPLSGSARNIRSKGFVQQQLPRHDMMLGTHP